MEARLYARVSHSSGDQDPEVQLRPLRAYAEAHGWDVAGVYVDKAPAVSERRLEWARLMQEAQPGEVVLVWRLDRAFRSVLQAAQDIAAMKVCGIVFASMMEGFDLTTNVGELLFDILAAFAAFERRTLRERILAGQSKARAEGKSLGGYPHGIPRNGQRGKKVAVA